MTFEELIRQYPDRDFFSNHGDAEFRYSVWAPFFRNLHEGKIVYHERFTWLARVENLKLDERGVNVRVVPLITIENGGGELPRTDPWDFGGSWEMMMLGRNGGLGMPYCSWIIWTEAFRVKAVEEFLADGDHMAALALTLYEGSGE